MRNSLHFSYSSLNMLRTASHCWINKTLGIKPETTVYMTAGSNGHRIIQDHLAGIKKDDRLAFLEDKFPIVEITAFDKNCKFSIEVDGYEVIGYFDAKDPENKRFGEIKLSGTMWTPRRFQDLPQRKIYALAEPSYTNSVLFTGSLNPNDWSTPEGKKNMFKIIDVPLTQKDRDEALAWIREGLAIFEAGDFNIGLDDEGRCIMGRQCPWGGNCHFKKI